MSNAVISSIVLGEVIDEAKGVLWFLLRVHNIYIV